MDKRFSIIVPVYNVSDYLEECLDSLLRQEYSDYEVILVNDGSTDTSEKICKDYAERYDFVKYYYKENGGLSSARNYGIEKASGDYMLFIDSDDFLVDDSLLKKLNALLDCDADFSAFLPIEYSFDRKTVVKTHDSFGLPLNKLINAKDVIDELYSTENAYMTMAATKIIRRDFLINNKLFFTNGIYHEDDEWIARVLFCYPKTILTDIVGYGYRHRDNSIVRSESGQAVFKKACDRLGIAQRVSEFADVTKYRKCLTFFADYYIQTFWLMSKFRDKTQEFLEYANGFDFVRKMRFSLNRKHRFISLYSRLFGVKAANRLILRIFFA